MKFPYSLQGMIYLPIVVIFIFTLQITVLAKFIFLPLIFMYKIFGTVPTVNNQEFFFILLYWAAVGFLVGFLLDTVLKRDQYNPQSQYSPGPRPPL